MAAITTPIDAMFEMQRTAIKQTREAFERSLEMNKRASELFLEAIETGETARKQSAAVTEAAVDAYFDAVQATVPGDAGGIEELRASAHEQLEAAGQLQADTVARMTELLEENAEASEQFVDEWSTTVEEGFDAALTAAEEMEAQAVDAAEAVEIDVEDAE